MSALLGYAPARRRAPWMIGGLAALVVVGFAVLAILWSGATLAADPGALARVDLQPFAGTLESATASTPDGHPIALLRQGSRLTPATRLSAGQAVSVEVVVRRPGWLGWALGKERHERLTIHAPVAHVENRWLIHPAGRMLQVKFDTPVSAVAFGSGALRRQPTRAASRTVDIPIGAPAGSLQVAAATRPWERIGAPVRVSWFPSARGAVALASPPPNAKLNPASALRLTFSKPVTEVLGSSTPRLTPATPGHWRRVDSHTLVFQPSGFGARMGGPLTVSLPRAVAVAGPSGSGLRTTSRIQWSVRAPSVLRLHQLLAEAGYLPLDWTPDGQDAPRTPGAEARAAVVPPTGTFGWRFAGTPPELRQLWKPDQVNEITRGAVMMFQDNHHLAVDAVAGPTMWRALLADAIAGRHRGAGYSYVYVHRGVPQSLTLWHNGHTVLRSPGNTGVPAAPTQLGTFPVFEHIAVGTMSGTNPDGSHYHDPGIRWISYFNGGDAIHSFNRASFGTPQSLGCVELPLASAAKVWPYTPIGTLVTVEN